jgi:hypothetical protein
MLLFIVVYFIIQETKKCHMPYCLPLKSRIQNPLHPTHPMLLLLIRRMTLATLNSQGMSGAGSVTPVQSVMPGLQTLSTPTAQGAVLGLPSPHQPVAMD